MPDWLWGVLALSGMGLCAIGAVKVLFFSPTAYYIESGGDEEEGYTEE